ADRERSWVIDPPHKSQNGKEVHKIICGSDLRRHSSYSLRIGDRLDNAVEGRSRSGRRQPEGFARKRDVVAAVVRLLELQPKLVLIDGPLATLLHSHRKASQRTVAFIDKAIMHLVGELHPYKLCSDLCA